jgi:hypothetical protein
MRLARAQLAELQADLPQLPRDREELRRPLTIALKLGSDPNSRFRAATRIIAAWNIASWRRARR